MTHETDRLLPSIKRKKKMNSSNNDQEVNVVSGDLKLCNICS